MNKYLFFDSSSSGHHGEYFENIIYSLDVQKSLKSTILASPLLKNRLENYKAKRDSRIRILYLSSDELNLIKNTKGRINKGFKELKIISKYIRIHKFNKLIFLNLGIQIIPLAFFKPSPNVSISGIYLQNISFSQRGFNHSEKRKIRIRKFRQLVNLSLMLSNRDVRRVYILNDSKVVRFLNSFFRTRKFEMIYDPLPANSLNHKEKNTNSELCEFSFVGMVQKRKGIVEFLNALLEIKDKIPGKIQVNFLGLNSDDKKYQESVTHLISKLKSEIINFKFYNKFVDYEELNIALHNSHCILAVYKNHFYSSGMLAHSCKHKKPLIVSESGFLGEYVTKNKLGLSVNPDDPQSYSKAILAFINNDFNYNFDAAKNYNLESSPQKFTNRLFT